MLKESGAVGTNESNVDLSPTTEMERRDNKDWRVQLFPLQFDFAKAIAQRTGQSLEEALVNYTIVHHEITRRYDRDSNDSAWKEYVEGLQSVEDPAEYTKQFYFKQKEKGKASGEKTHAAHEQFGCFSFTVHEGGVIRIHFRNEDSDPAGPLSRSRMEQRKEELAAMFRRIRETVPEARTVRGMSWLYNREGYRRLFPEAYVAGMEEMPVDFQSRSLWGQFLDKQKGLNPELVQKLLDNLKDPSKKVEDCFPFKTMKTEAPIEEFYRLYGVG